MKHKYIKDVTTLEYESDKCNGCGRCSEVCPHGVFDMADKKAFITDKNYCIECGACVLNCPSEAISVNAGVGCAAAVIYSWVTGKEPTCGCPDDGVGGGSCC